MGVQAHCGRATYYGAAVVVRACYRRPYESEIEQRTCELVLHELSVFNIKLAKTNETGSPDRLFLIPGGKPLFVEFKRPGGVVSARQALMLKRLQHFGYDAVVCDSVESAMAAIKARM